MSSVQVGLGMACWGGMECSGAILVGAERLIRHVADMVSV